MKSLLCLIAVCVQSEEIDTVSLLQTRKPTKEDVGSMIYTAGQNFVVQDVQDKPKVERFIADLQSFVQGGGLSSEEALLQRASRSGRMEPLVEAFADMSSPTQSALVEAGSVIYKAMPEIQQIALAQHLEGSKALDAAMVGKTKTRNFWEGGMKVKETETRNGHHYHKHRYEHNGRGGNAKTSTVSQTGNVRHTHDTSHNYNANNGRTATRTDTATSGTGYAHSHSTDHVNTNQKTETDTATLTVGAGKASGHSTSTEHNKVTGKTYTATR